MLRESKWLFIPSNRDVVSISAVMLSLLLAVFSLTGTLDNATFLSLHFFIHFQKKKKKHTKNKETKRKRQWTQSTIENGDLKSRIRLAGKFKDNVSSLCWISVSLSRCYKKERGIRGYKSEAWRLFENKSGLEKMVKGLDLDLYCLRGLGLKKERKTLILNMVCSV